MSVGRPNRADRRRGKRTGPAIAPGITITGGPGDAPENAYVIVGARTTREACDAELAHLAKLFGVQGLAWNRADARTVKHGGLTYDEILLESMQPGRARWRVFYDITQLVGQLREAAALAGGEDESGEAVAVERFRFSGPAGQVIIGGLCHGPRGHGFIFNVARVRKPIQIQCAPTLATREEAVAALEAKLETVVPRPWSDMPWNDAQPKEPPPWKA